MEVMSHERVSSTVSPPIFFYSAYKKNSVMKKTPYIDIVNNWFHFVMNNKKVKSNHTAMYLYIVNKANNLFSCNYILILFQNH